MTAFGKPSIDDTVGDAALVTGGTDGIGKEIARGLAARGIQVAIVGRNAEKGTRTEQELRRATQNPAIDFIAADLGLMHRVEQLADDIARRWASLRYLVLNAGVVLGRRELTAEGTEASFAINYLGRFVLARRLLPLLAAAGKRDDTARIVVVGGAARHGKIYFDDVNLTANFATLRAVQQSCRANDLFVLELARQLSAARSPVTVTCLKIGVAKTNIRQAFPRWMKILVPLLMDPLLGQTPAEAAEAALRLLLDRSYEGVTGARFSKITRMKRIASVDGPDDADDARRLWWLSERLATEALVQIESGVPTSVAAT